VVVNGTSPVTPRNTLPRQAFEDSLQRVENDADVPLKVR